MKYYFNTLKNHYADFSGRARRKEYWFFTLFNTLFIFGLILISGFWIVRIIAGLFILGTIIPGIAVAVRRMHDVGKEWWYILIPIYNLILCLTEGQKGPNEYGEDPKMLDM